MKKSIFTALLLLVVVFTMAQNKNTTLLGNYTYSPTAYGLLNDVWGYVDTLGNEYALVGAQKGVSIVNVTDPSNLNEVFYASGVSSIWRDIKVWNKHAFITNESSGGMMIIDLSSLPGSITSNDIYYYTGSSFPFSKAHNIYIDENGVAYIFGSNYGAKGGAVMLDVNTNPKVPVELGAYDSLYFHDGMVRGDTLWGSAIYAGVFVVLDVSNKSNPVFLQSHFTADKFTHNTWISDDGNTLFTTDEVSNGEVGAYDVSDLSNIQQVGSHQSNPGSLVIPHNTHVYGDFLVTSYYRDGVTIVDATYPELMVQVGDFDSSPLSGNGFNGDWGAYPWLPSGNLLVSDRENGLFVIGVDYKKAVYLQGNTRRLKDSLKIASVEIISLLNTDTLFSNLNGFYKKAYPDSGLYRFAFNKTGYLPDTLDLIMNNGVMHYGDIYMRSETPFKLKGRILNNSQVGLQNAEIFLSSKYFSYRAKTDAQGVFEVDSFYEGDYEITAGKWGYVNYCQQRAVLPGDSLIYTVNKDIMDDATLDFGWSTINTGSGAGWEREEFNSDQNVFTLDYPSKDVNGDCSRFAFVTGASGALDHDVDGAWAQLISPSLDLSGIRNPFVHFSFWFKNTAPSGMEDSLKFMLTSTGDTVLLMEIHNQNNSLSSVWVDTSIYLGERGVDLSDCHFMVLAGDFGSDHLLEVGFDNMFLSEGFVGLTVSKVQGDAKVFPVPFTNVLYIQLPEDLYSAKYEVLDLTGRIVLRGRLNSNFTQLGMESIPEGMYIVNLRGDGNFSRSLKVIKGSL